MRHARLRAPTLDRAILAEPPLDEAAAIVAANLERLVGWSHDFQGRPASHVRAITRSAVIAASRDYCHNNPTPAIGDPQSAILEAQSSIHAQPFILSGHQPELFHPGVWLKNFAAHAIARMVGGVPLHLIVDTDTVKRTTVRVPTGDRDSPSVVHVPLDRWPGEIPFEEYAVGDETAFASFGDRVRAAMAPLGVRPLVAELWPRAVAASRESANLCERISRARREQEAAWGCPSIELPISRLCQTEGFFWFASHVLAQLDRFTSVYNGSLADYRRANHIRSRNHPVPSLGDDGDWHETPFRVWTSERPRRHALFVRQLARELELTNRDGWTARLPLAPDREACCAVEALAELARQGVKLRTRALTTTIFTRLCVADLFIHGLGGALYDEVADAIIARFFEVEPPRFLTLTGTLHLPIAGHAAREDDARALRRLARDLIHNPDRHLNVQAAAHPDVAETVLRKRQQIRAEPATRAERRLRFAEIRRLNRSLAPAVAELRAATDERIHQVEASLEAGAILRSREWAFCVHPAESLREFLRPFLA